MRRKSKAYPSEERRQMATKKREAAKEKAQQAKLKRDKEKKASMRTKAWRLKVKISNLRPAQSTSLPPKENPFSKTRRRKK